MDEYTYVIRKRSCRCVTALCVDDSKHPARTIAFLGESLRHGDCYAERVADDVLRSEVFEEATFLRCPHEERAETLPLLPGI